jgi:hypothetical protein
MPTSPRGADPAPANTDPRTRPDGGWNNTEPPHHATTDESRTAAILTVLAGLFVIALILLL